MEQRIQRVIKNEIILLVQTRQSEGHLPSVSMVVLGPLGHVFALQISKVRLLCDGFIHYRRGRWEKEKSVLLSVLQNKHLIMKTGMAWLICEAGEVVCVIIFGLLELKRVLL